MDNPVPRPPIKRIIPKARKKPKQRKGNWPYIKARRGLRRNMFRG